MGEAGPAGVILNIDRPSQSLEELDEMVVHRRG